MGAGLVEFEGVVAMADSGRALLVDIDGNEKWIPKSLISEDSEVQNHEDEGTLIIQEWWAIQEGLV